MSWAALNPSSRSSLAELLAARSSVLALAGSPAGVPLAESVPAPLAERAPASKWEVLAVGREADADAATALAAGLIEAPDGVVAVLPYLSSQAAVGWTAGTTEAWLATAPAPTANRSEAALLAGPLAVARVEVALVVVLEEAPRLLISSEGDSPSKSCLRWACRSGWAELGGDVEVDPLRC